MHRIMIRWAALVLSLCAAAQARENNLTAKVRGGYFLLTSELMQKVYRHGGADFELEFGARLHEDLNAWINFNIFRRDSKNFGFCDPLSLHLYPLSAGLVYAIAPDSIVSPYLGLGASYSFITLEGSNGQPLTPRQLVEQGTWGAVGKSGLLIAFSEHYAIDLFADYYYTKPCTDHRAPNVGGIRLGLGLSCNF